MIEPLKPYEMDINLNVTEEDVKDDEEVNKYLEIITIVNKAFCDYDLSLEEGEFILECLLHGVREIRFKGFIDFNNL